MSDSGNEKLTEEQKQEGFLRNLKERPSARYLEDSVFKSVDEEENGDKTTKKPKTKSAVEQQEDIKHGVGFIFDFIKFADAEDRGQLYNIFTEFVGCEMNKANKEAFTKKLQEAGFFKKYFTKKAEGERMDNFDRVTEAMKMFEGNSDVKSLFSYGDYLPMASAMGVFMKEDGSFVNLENVDKIAGILEKIDIEGKNRNALLKSINRTKEFNKENNGGEKWKNSILDSFKKLFTIITNVIFPGACLAVEAAKDKNKKNNFFDDIGKKKDELIKGIVDLGAEAAEGGVKKIEGMEKAEKEIKERQQQDNRKNEVKMECDELGLDGETVKSLANALPSSAASQRSGKDSVEQKIIRVGKTLGRVATSR
jgi:hypothetical protein